MFIYGKPSDEERERDYDSFEVMGRRMDVFSFSTPGYPFNQHPFVFQDWVDGVFAFHPASMQCSFSKSTWYKPHLRPLALCVSLEDEAEGRIGVSRGVGSWFRAV